MNNKYKKLLKKLFFINRNIVSKENNKAMKEIKKKYKELKIYNFYSGEKVFDWTIPKSWVLKKAYVKNSKGEKIIDAKKNILNLVIFSSKFNGVLTKSDLLKKLHFSEKLPGSIPYVTSYYKKDWGFCVEKDFLKSLNDENYKIVIDSKFKNGNLVAGELTIKGKTKKEVVLTSYICHPRQANDGLSGVIMLLKLYDFLKKIKTKYTYRFLFFPETIGSIAMLSKNIINKNKVEYAIVSTCVGKIYDKPTYKNTFLNNHSIDNLVKHVLKNKLEIRNYFPYGSDERQFSSPGIQIPAASIMGVPYGEFKEYHTSFDNLKFFNWNDFDFIFEIYKFVILKYEEIEKYISTISGCEPMLGKRNLYDVKNNTFHTKKSLIRNWILNMCDGKNNLLDISIKSGYSYEEILNESKLLLEKKLIKSI